MLLYHYDIESPINNYLYRLRIICLSYLSKLKTFLKLKNLRTGAIARVTKQVEQIYLISEGLRKVIEENEVTSTESLVKFHSRLQRLLKRHLSYYTLLEKSGFLGQIEIKNLSELTLANFYAVEAKVRHLAYPENAKDSDDENLKDFITQLSLGSLPA